MEHFTRREKNMICIYDPGSRIGLMAELNDMIGYLMPDETALLHLAESVIGKLERMTDDEYHQLADSVEFDIKEDDHAG